MTMINRFPKMAALQKERAKRLGYDEGMAKIIGYAQAKKYAIFKNKAFAMPKKKGRGKKAGYVIPEGKPWTVDPVFKLYIDKDYKVPVVGGTRVTVRDYEKALAKFEPKVQRIIEKWAAKIIATVPEEILKNESKFFNKVWKVVRDQNPLEEAA